ncbi:ABZJ_00895 family protein [Thioclava sp. 'Guangxiensis']|uniref:ABZJ_00895 family protein n=1 Tax=Thioclava sp. 'Guangxiensis' TaxID=3149044 RepID=UPI003877DD8E
MNFKRYILVLVATMLGLGVLLTGLSMAGIYIEARSIALIPVIIAAFVEGQCYAQKHERLPTKGDAWRFGLQAGMVVMVLQCLAGAAFYWLVPESFTGLTLAQFAVYVLAALGAIFVLTAVASRFIFRNIAKSTLKAQAKRAARQAKT